MAKPTVRVAGVRALGVVAAAVGADVDDVAAAAVDAAADGASCVEGSMTIGLGVDL